MRRISISSAIPTESQPMKILMEGELVINNAKQLKDKLITELAKAQEVELELKNIKLLDISVIQLFIAIQKSAVKQGKQVNFKIEITEYMTSTLKAYGLTNLFSEIS